MVMFHRRQKNIQYLCILSALLQRMSLIVWKIPSCCKVIPPFNSRWIKVRFRSAVCAPSPSFSVNHHWELYVIVHSIIPTSGIRFTTTLLMIIWELEKGELGDFVLAQFGWIHKFLGFIFCGFTSLFWLNICAYIPMYFMNWELE